MKKFIKITLWVLSALAVIALLGGFMAWRWYQGQLDGASGSASGSGTAAASDDIATVQVPLGTGTNEIGELLSAAGVIESDRAWRLYVRLEDVGPFQAGEYGLARDLGIRAAALALEAGPEIAYEKLLAPPGLTLDEIAKRVAALGGRSESEFLAMARSGASLSGIAPADVATLEGLLFPDTYYINQDDDEAVILQRMITQFETIASEIDLEARASELGLTPYEIVIVASLIQTEAGTSGDGPKIAAVIYNRLDAGMPLQIDATVLYAIGTHKTHISPDDLAFDSPYNTYQTTQLPPTPIASVTRAALEAALSPVDANYLFYVLSDAQGHHAFSETYDEFLDNKAAAREKGLLG